MPHPLRLLLNVLFAFYTVGSLAQQVTTIPDTSYVMTLLQRAEAIEMQQPQTALKQYQQAYVFACKLQYDKGYFASVRLMAYVLDLLGRHGESHKIAMQGLQKALQDTVQEYRSVCYFALAQSAKWQGRHKEAIGYFKQSAPYRLAHKDRRKAASLYQNLGVLYELEGLYPQALIYFDRALQNDRLAQSSPQELGMDYFSIANVYVKQHQLPRASTYFWKAEALFDQTRDVQLLISVYGNLANLHRGRAQYDSSLYYYAKARRLNQSSDNSLKTLHLLAGQAGTYNLMKRFGVAKSLLDTAYTMAKSQHAGLTEFRLIYLEYINATVGLGQYKDATGWYERYVTVEDSLSTIEAKTLLEDYEVELRQAAAARRLAEKQRRIDQLEQTRQRQQLWLLLVSLAGVLVLGGAVFTYLYNWQRQRAAASAMLVAQREGDLAMVQSELQGQQKERLRIAKEMHDDLGASLTAIGLLSEVIKRRMGVETTPEVEKISAISGDMVTTMNEIIWSLNTRNDSLNGLIAYTRAYASEFIDNTSLLLITRVEESPLEITIGGTDRRNVFLTVKEAMHNVVKHAGATQISLTIRPEPTKLLIAVDDNGHGFTLTEHTHLRNGLSNMQNRMRESGGTCEITSSEIGTSVRIIYPYPTERLDKIGQM